MIVMLKQLIDKLKLTIGVKDAFNIIKNAFHHNKKK